MLIAQMHSPPSFSGQEKHLSCQWLISFGENTHSHTHTSTRYALNSAAKMWTVCYVCVCVAVCAVSFRIYLTTRKPFFCSAHGHKFNFIFIPSTLLACLTCGVRLAFFVRCPFFSLLIPFSPMPCSCPWISSSVVLCIFSFCLSES